MNLTETQKTFRTEQNTKDLFSNYAEYNKNLRTWFITFGIGGPGTILLNEPLRTALVNSGAIKQTVYAFLIGCAIQIVMGFVNKYTSWYQYCDAIVVSAPGRSPLRPAFALCSKVVWPDIVADILTAGCFGYAVLLMVRTFIK